MGVIKFCRRGGEAKEVSQKSIQGREASKRDSVTVKGLGRNWDALVKGSLATEGS